MGVLFSRPTAASALHLPLQVNEKFGIPSEQTSSVSNLHWTMIQKNAPFVGTLILSDGSFGTVCLLAGNTVITCLHVILNYKTLLNNSNPQLINFSREQGTVVFVKNSKIYRYNVVGIDHSGLENFIAFSLSAPASSYDYAVLKLDGNPNSDLDGNFALDPIDHFKGPSVTDPRNTLAISGPEIIKNTQGGIDAIRYCSLAENVAAEGEYYHYQQLGTHYAVPGLSGQAIMPIDSSTETYHIGNSILYALHSYLDRRSSHRAGIKISEYMRFRSIAFALPERGEKKIYLEFYDIFQQLISQEGFHSVKDVNTITGRVIPGDEITMREAIGLLRAHKNVIADKQSEARDIGKKAFGAVIPHPEQHQVTGLPHFHDAHRQYRSHVFFIAPKLL